MNDTPLTGSIQFEDKTAPVAPEQQTKEPEVIEQAREKSPSPAEGDKTSDEKPNAPFVSGGKKAREIGERQKKLAQTLIDEARRNPSAAQSLKQVASNDPSLAEYLKKNWASEYGKIMNGEEEEISIDDAARIHAKAEFLSEQIKAQKEDDLMDFAERLSFTSDEAEQLKELASKLEGSTLGGITLDFHQAMKKAAYAIREDKAKAGAIHLPSGMPQAQIQNVEKEVEVDLLASKGRKLTGRKADDIKKNLQIVEQGLKGNVFEMPM